MPPLLRRRTSTVLLLPLPDVCTIAAAADAMLLSMLMFFRYCHAMLICHAAADFMLRCRAFAMLLLLSDIDTLSPPYDIDDISYMLPLIEIRYYY